MLIYKVRDYASLVPRDFGDRTRESLLGTCLAIAPLRERGINEQDREATFVVTDPSLDSYKEIIDAGAFDQSIPAYMRNPVLLPEHQHVLYGSPYVALVGHCRRLVHDGDALLGTFRFDDDVVGEHRWGKVLSGSLRAVSVGFRPVNTNRDADGILHYTEALIKEFSTCSVPANDNALLVNAYIAGQLGRYAVAGGDGGRSAELAAAAEELREAVESLRAESAATFGEEPKRTAYDDHAQRIEGMCESVIAAIG